MCWEGINGTVPYPAYFRVGNQWYRISYGNVNWGFEAGSP